MAYNILILGASYGSLLATKMLFGGHKITMVCLPAEIEAFNGDGARVRPDRSKRFGNWRWQLNDARPKRDEVQAGRSVRAGAVRVFARDPRGFVGSSKADGLSSRE